MGRLRELADLKERAENEINGLDTSALDDIAQGIVEFLEKWDPDGENSDDPILEAAASLGSSLEDLSADVDYAVDALGEVDDVLSNE